MPTNVKAIETVEEFEDAKKRIAKLDTSMPGSPEEEEQKSLIRAVEKWQHDHGRMPKTIKPQAG
ncbi:MAG TPA: hypothetical protein VGV17_14355 [Bosea sp. (in: a-proteobacteria)]|jgi:hypothetical protein|uniref:hypothetical protein n=1 Tax=Bosea sp. (in: a-proteobacteria) TaxID=1871050 RepID=UPI002DDD4AEC|nr:hypothetical protein [Bosea sp. (in: a-proteobacteria)]HEV2554935.1 hypothetical protein [Bosea sp. (in: a-proteobacteria)]